jgi:hypothetical protein
MSFRPEGYPEHWVDGHTLYYIKDAVVVGMLVMNPEDGFEAQFAKDFAATSWVYACDAWSAGATVPPSIGYSYDGTDFSAPVEEVTE